MMREPHDIRRVEAGNNDAVLRLENGVVLHISSNDGYLNLHFSGEKGKVRAEQTSANDVNIHYKPWNNQP